MLHMSIHINLQIEFIISIRFKFQIQFVMFIRGHPETPIDRAPVLLSGIWAYVGTGGKPSTREKQTLLRSWLCCWLAGRLAG